MQPENIKLLKQEAQKLSLELNENQLKRFELYLNLIIEYNSKINLTAIKDEKGIVVKHFIDSLAGAKFLGKGWFVADFGSGMGCPGLALKIAREDLKMILLESNQKKVAFLNQVIRKLSLENIKAIAQRVDDKMFQLVLAGQIDAVLARAFGKLDLIAKLASPYLKKGGIVLAYKGPKAFEEVKQFKKEIEKNKLKLKDSFQFTFPDNMGERIILVLKKS